MVRRRTRKELEKLDEQVLSFIRAYILREGVPPSREEIARALRVSNLMVAQRSVLRLKKQGLLEFSSNAKRGLEVIDNAGSSPSDIVSLPILGKIAAGQPIEVINPAVSESSEFTRSHQMSVPAAMIRGAVPHFVLRVQGDSMIDDQICDGDWIIVRNQSTADNGETVVALVDNEATLKRYFRKSGQIELHPANQSHHPIIVREHQQFRIAGIFVGLIRMGTGRM